MILPNEGVLLRIYSIKVSLPHTVGLFCVQLVIYVVLCVLSGRKVCSCLGHAYLFSEV